MFECQADVVQAFHQQGAGVGGYLKMPLLACTIYMAIGKFLRYVLMTSALVWVFPGGFSF